jgi:uncharacterized protein involved in exopolysaccharide biosynthesis
MNTPSVETQDETLDAREFLALLRGRKWLILGAVALCSAALWTAALLMTPVYRVTTVLAPARAEGGLGGLLGGAMGQLGGLAEMAGVSIGGGDEGTEEALAVLGSQEFTRRFIVQENLLPKLYASKWDATASKWAVGPGKEPTLAKAAKLFSTSVRTIARDRKTGLVTLNIDWRDRQEALEWNHKLVAMLNEDMRRRAMTDADNYIKYLESELAATTLVDTRLAVSRLLEAQVKQRMMAKVTREYAFRIVDSGMVPDADDPIRPKKLKMFLLGPAVGLVLGVGYVLLAWALGGTGPSSRPSAIRRDTVAA